MTATNDKNENLLLQLKRVVENDKAFMNNEFLSYYARIVFGRKPTPDLKKNASLLAKEFKSFIRDVEKKQKDSGISLISLSSVERKLLETIGKAFRMNQKIIDGDVALDEFRSVLQKDNTLSSEEARAIIDVLVQQETLTDDVVTAIEEKFNERKCMFSSLGQYQMLHNFITDGYKQCEDWDGFVENFNNLLQSSLMETKLANYDKSNIVFMSEQNMDDFIKKEQSKFRIPTGYRTIDWAFNGGFENGRVYMFGGISGGGKSLVLVNLAARIKNSLDSLAEQDMLPEKFKNKKPAVLYLTLENSCEETKTRFICSTFAVSTKQLAASQYVDSTESYYKMYDQVYGKGAEVIIAWRPAKSVNALDLMSMVNDIERKNNVSVATIFVDYADKMNAVNSSKTDQEWRDLGSIVDELKALAVDYDISCATVTQLTKSAYDKDGGNKSGGTLISGSVRKRENTDAFVLFDFNARDQQIIESDNDMENAKKDGEPSMGLFEEVWAVIDKNRDGPSNVRFRMYIDYSTYRLADKESGDHVFRFDKDAGVKTGVDIDGLL